MKHFILFIFILNITIARAQQAPSKSVSVAALRIPDSVTKSTNGISSFIKHQFSEDSDRLRAIFVWEAANISYDVDNMFALTYNDGREEKIAKALLSRKAICEGYAELFAELSNECGIKTIIIEGYTKQRGMVDYIPHAWVGANLYNKWYLFDPTWSSGFLENGKFVKIFSNRYYKIPPAEMIKTHMPFDPMYQFLNYPLTTQEFYEGKFVSTSKKPVFNFADSLQVHLNLPEIQKLRNTARRIESNGVRSSMILQMLQYLKNREFNIQADIYNSAGNKANEAINLFNKYIEFKNKQFQPKKEDKEIEGMLAIVQDDVDTASTLLLEIKETDQANLKQSAGQLQTLISDLQNKIVEEKKFVNKYINTKKIFRPMLFGRLFTK